MVDNIVAPGEQIKPQIDLAGAVKLAERLYGIKVDAADELVGYDDKNYHLKVSLPPENEFMTEIWPHGYVMKIMNSSDSMKLDYVDGQGAMMLFLEKNRISTPQPQRSIDGRLYCLATLQSENQEESKQHVVRLLTYVDGTLLKDVPWSYELHFNVGKYAAQIDLILKEFSHPAYKLHSSLWHVKNIPKLKEFLFVLEDERKALVENVITEFEQNVLSTFDSLLSGVIHGDINEQNLLCKQNSEGMWEVTSVLDLGDSHLSPYLVELALAMTYMMIQSGCVESGTHVAAGYCSLHPLPTNELKLLKVCVCARLCQSLVLGLYTYSQCPDNTYVLTTQAAGWTLLQSLWAMDSKTIEKTWFGQPISE